MREKLNKKSWINQKIYKDLWDKVNRNKLVRIIQMRRVKLITKLKMFNKKISLIDLM